MKSLSIKNYKNLEALQIDNLRSVNLIAGENNVGKSSLLEAISIYQSGGRLDWLKQLLEFRGEGVDYLLNTEERIQKEMERFLSFVPNFDEKRMFDLPIVLSPLGEQNPFGENFVSIRFVHYTESELYDNGLTQTIRTVIADYHANRDYENIGIGLEITSNTKTILYPFQGSRMRPQTETATIMQYVRMGDTKKVNNPSLFDRLALTPMEKKVVEALQIIEPRIIDLNFLKDDKRSSSSREDERIPYIIFAGETKPRRLSSMGDGINRILTIALAMLNCKGGVLLIDEFENGLHHSIQRKLWKVIFKLSKELRIQVFATTHSNDTIRSFADENDDELGLFIRLEYRKEKVEAVCYDHNEDLALVLEQNIEIR